MSEQESLQINRDLITRYAQLMKILAGAPEEGDEEKFQRYQAALREQEQIDAFLATLGLKLDYAFLRWPERKILCIQVQQPVSLKEMTDGVLRAVE